MEFTGHGVDAEMQLIALKATETLATTGSRVRRYF
jgi:hypothetical protein